MTARPPLPHRRRAWTLGVLVPVLVTAAAWVAVAVLLPRVPRPAALHWGPAGVDRSGSVAELLGPIAVISSISLVVMAVIAVRTGRQAMTRRLALGLAVGLATMFAGLVLAPIVAQVDAPSAEHAGSPGAATLAAMATAVLLGAAAAALAGADRAAPARSPVPADATTTELREGQRAAWVRRASVGPVGRTVSLVGAGLLAALAVVMGAASGSWWLTPVILVPVPVMLLLLSWHVRVDRTGLTVRAGIGRPRQHVPAAEVVRADVVTVDPFGEFGGWGLRVSAALDGTVGVVLRRGEAIAVERTGGRRLVVTVDDAAGGAALLNTYAQRARPARPALDGSTGTGPHLD